MQTKEDLTGDEKKRLEADIDATNMILLGIPDGILNCFTKQRIIMRVQDPLALVAKSYASPSSSQPSPAYCVTHTPSNQAYVQDGRINVQSKNVGNVGNGRRNTRRSVGSLGNHAYVQKTNASTKPTVRDSKYFKEQMLLAKKDEARIHINDSENVFLLVDATKEDELEELNASCIMMARIQTVNNEYDVEQMNDSYFINEINSANVKQVTNDHYQQRVDIESLIRNVKLEAEKQHKVNEVVKQVTALLTKDLEKYKELKEEPVHRNKLNENGDVSRNKARLVAQDYNQQEDIDYDETYASVARLESIRILLAYACALDFKLLQMDVKNAFLNGFINDEVYVAQPLGFIDFEKPDHVYKLKKALYGLKHAPKAWYDRLKAFLIKHEYNMGMVDSTLFTKRRGSNLIIIQIYVDDIIFGLTCQDMCDDFSKIMHDKFEMSMMGELNFFLGLQIKQMEDGIFFNQSKYIKEMLKKFGLEDSKPRKTPMSSDTKLTKDKECESVDSTKYRGMIGSLLYLTASRPDIMFSVCLCARFQEDPKTTHLEAVKRIF
ncbi:retrovirus-related pol polyprotein from transposon TNT 1-94 [Tanacetum coccineum]